MHSSTINCCGGHPTRRAVLRGLAGGLGTIALAELLASNSALAATNTSTDAPGKNSASGTSVDPGAAARVFPARAKRVIFLFMHGGPSHIDTFDYKPLLHAHDGKELPFAKPRVQFAKTGNLLRSPWRFRQYGQSGAWVSDLFQQTAAHVDDMTFIKSMHGSNAAHGGALLKVHTGSDTFVRPSMGAWISYGLGTENQNLPSFITINPTLGHGGVQNFGAAFLPAQHQATRIGASGGKKGRAGSIANLENTFLSTAEQREQLQLTQAFNRHQIENSSEDSQLAARIEALELAFRMQTEAPEVLDLKDESEATLRLYGIDQEATQSFGRSCLMARRLSEAGVRFVQATHAYWDQHSELKEKHSELAGQVDRPIAGLLTDLKNRGLLEETLVIWGAEFGRTPTAQGNNGRDHNPHAFTYWMAGGGVKRGFSYGETDDYGFYAAHNKVHVHDFHATLLYLLGIDHLRLTYRLGGRDFRLTDIHGTVIHDVVG